MVITARVSAGGEKKAMPHVLNVGVLLLLAMDTVPCQARDSKLVPLLAAHPAHFGKRRGVRRF